VKDIQLAKDNVLISFDVEALKQFDTWLKTLKLEKPLAALYTKVEKLCTEQTQFQFRGAYYILANI
jgi:hypothetical protein